MAVHISSLPLPSCLETHKGTTGKIRSRWSGGNRFNPIKAKRPNTPEAKVSDQDAIDADIETPVPVKACNRFRLSCSYSKQGALILHPKNQTGIAKTGMELRTKERKRQKSLTYCQTGTCQNPNPILIKRQTMMDWPLVRLQI